MIALSPTRRGCHPARGVGHLSGRLAENLVRVIGIGLASKRGQKWVSSSAFGAHLSVDRKWLGRASQNAAMFGTCIATQAGVGLYQCL